MDFEQIIADAKSNWERRRAGGCENVIHGARCAIPLGPDDGYLCPRCSGIMATMELEQRLRPALESIPPRYRWAQFGFLHAPTGIPADTLSRLHKATPGARDALTDFQQGRRAVVTVRGASRRGKTALACAMLDAAIRGGDHSALFVSARAFSRACSEHGFGRGQPAAFMEAAQATLLVIDDVGSERGSTSQARDYVSDVLDDRINADLSTIVTTWLDEETATTMYGGGVAARLFQDALVLDMGPVVS